MAVRTHRICPININRLSHAAINIKYTAAEVKMKANPYIHIFFRSFIPISIVMMNKSAHIAQGLKPSIISIITVSTGKEIVEALT